ncbi:LamG domain-containing protein [Streptomyces hainanensis]|uniref:LamG domain-containing protein n=1 Tax=Streptomyces hainanensis TaxID=402648 RepID=A0A4R4T7S7_9ACTN|nr:LamG domain-containing protein [Streptomyces hainanensis]TDC73100.1 LamG domain-containing protein [Streptomyces hainanensis]
MRTVVSCAAGLGMVASLLVGATGPALADQSETPRNAASGDGDRPPPQISVSQLSMEYGGACAPAASPAQVRTPGQIYAADVTDPDGDRVAVEFRAYWDTGDGQGNIVRWAPGLTTFKASGSGFSGTLPSDLPHGGHVQWEARSYDGVNYSPWSSDGDQEACNFVYDTSVPAQPTVTSPDYPASETNDPHAAWRDGVGKYGEFTFSSSDADVNRYLYRYSASGQETVDEEIATTNGAPRTVRLFQGTAGVHRLEVSALDAAGNSSGPRIYDFYVLAGAPERAVWDLDEDIDSPVAVGEGEAWSARLTGDVTTGAEGVWGSGLRFGGDDGYSRASNSLVDTSQSFSVSFWARLPESGATAGTAVSQAGNLTSGFDLSVDPDNGGWSFGLASSDASDAATTRVRQDAAARTGEWTHVVGVVDVPADEVVLYLDGERVGSATFDHEVWAARGATGVGARLSERTQGQFFNGDLDEVQFYDYGVTGAQVAALTEHQAVTSGGRPAAAIWSFDEPAGATSVSGHAQPVTATANAGVTFGAEGEFGNSARFDGTTGAVAAGQPVIDTAQSFAVSAWVNLPGDKANRDMAVAAQTADDGSGLALVHAADGQGWTMRRWNGGDDTVVEASQSPCGASAPDCLAAGLGTWTHVVGVQDVDAQELRVFVNGELAGTAPFTAAAPSTGGLTIGAAQHHEDGLVDHLAGRIDNVRVFDRVASANEVQRLSVRTQGVGGRWKFEDAEGGTTPDDSENDNPLTLGGDAGIGPGWIDYNALALDGADDFAATDRITVDTSDSFTVTAWAQAATVPSEGMTLLSAPGSNNSAFTVRFVPDPEREGHGRWEVVLPDADTPGASEVRISHSGFLDVRDWNHVALVYDAPRREAQLYVNGNLQRLGCSDPEGEICESVSWAEDVMTYEATGSLQVGRAGVGGAWGEHWAGSIDDLWLFDGALNHTQLRWLYGRFFDTPTEVPPGA